MKKWMSLLAACVMLFSAGYAEENAEVTPDLDLSTMSGTFVYAQVYQMMMDPDSYVGRVIRMKGYYDYFEDQATGAYYTACIVPDATACCAQGIEFVWAGEHAYPDDYPLQGEEILVTGRFETYMENETMYVHLADAQMEVVGGSET